MYYMVVKQGVKKIFSFNNPDCIAFERTPNAKIEDWILNDDLRFPEIYRHWTCQTPVKKYKLYKISINKSLHFAQKSLSSNPI